MVELKLGMKVKDNVTGAVGTITAIAEVSGWFTSLVLSELF